MISLLVPETKYMPKHFRSAFSFVLKHCGFTAAAKNSGWIAGAYTVLTIQSFIRISFLHLSSDR